MDITTIALSVAAVYCAIAYLVLVVATLRYRQDWETETFHLGLCFVLALGFLGLIETALLT
jgi:hypothetical protein